MNLNPDQIQALQNGEPVHLDEAGVRCVIVRADVYDKLKDVRYDDSDWTPEEMRAIAAQTFERADNS